LSLEGFKNLPRLHRQRLVELGSTDSVAVDAVHQLLANTPHELLAVREERAIHELPQTFATLPTGTPLPRLAVWQLLSPLERYALEKTAERALVRRDVTRYQAAYTEIVGATSVSTHLDASGKVRMVDVGEKPATRRVARAESSVTMSPEAFQLLSTNAVPKGNVLEVARIAGIMGTKRTADLIPLCHPLALSHVALDFTLEAELYRVRIECEASTLGPTGVEMEALTGATTAALTVYDMLKGVDRGMWIGPTRLLHKEGGQSGVFRASGPQNP